eukprot:764034-Hanusia_phi.AAC.6
MSIPAATGGFETSRRTVRKYYPGTPRRGGRQCPGPYRTVPACHSAVGSEAALRHHIRLSDDRIAVTEYGPARAPGPGDRTVRSPGRRTSRRPPGPAGSDSHRVPSHTVTLTRAARPPAPGHGD